MTQDAPSPEMMLAMNEALMLGSVRQHELTEAANHLNDLLQAEIRERKQVEHALSMAKAQLADRAGQLEELVAQRTSELTALNQQLETFVYSIAHDLRAPLRTMQGFSAMLVQQAGETLNETGKDQAERINKAAQFMDAMLLDLLYFSRVSHQHLELASVNLNTAVESVLGRLQEEIQQKKARVENSGPWPAVLAHEGTLGEVLFNLVSNALKFVTPDVTPVLRLQSEEREGSVRVWVIDNGPGIAPRHQQQIFQLFTRLDGGKYPGTGAGLAIARKAIERMGGRLGVESDVGQGSRFWFELRKSPAQIAGGSLTSQR